MGFGAIEERGMAELSVLHRFSSRKDEPQGSPANHLLLGTPLLTQVSSPLFFFFLLLSSFSLFFRRPVARLIVADSVSRELGNLWRLSRWIGRFVNTSMYLVRLWEINRPAASEFSFDKQEEGF